MRTAIDDSDVGEDDDMARSEVGNEAAAAATDEYADRINRYGDLIVG